MQLLCAYLSKLPKQPGIPCRKVGCLTSLGRGKSIEYKKAQRWRPKKICTEEKIEAKKKNNEKQLVTTSSKGGSMVWYACPRRALAKKRGQQCGQGRLGVCLFVRVLAHVSHPTWQAGPWPAGCLSRSACAAKHKWSKANPCHTLNRPVVAAGNTFFIY